MALGIEWVLAWARESARRVDEQRTQLGELDRAIGDGDHGENLDRGFHAVVSALNSLSADATPHDALRMIATTLISSVGGAAGPLYGTAFLRAADAVGDRADLDPTAVAELLAAARDGIVHRGSAAVGEKTMLDAWSPAADAAAAAAQAGNSATAVLNAAASAAEDGAVQTEPLIARKGRASYLGDRAIGHRDPGAQSSALILRAAADAAAMPISGSVGND
ncbi:dihydroxyacetone kinase subunit DhaL [Rathayibacter soli]|uniref:dihydroxyacetone kinase subunit DhaL n=1 Tax=Rathayibacter soli TaxID=3144168 RepID=UPI0027E4B068|nr:dihydroxyacetone kinase subunit DhaL [Glaciibacter superstes]